MKQVFEGRSRSSFEILEFEASGRHPGGDDKKAHKLEPKFGVW